MACYRLGFIILKPLIDIKYHIFSYLNLILHENLWPHPYEIQMMPEFKLPEHCALTDCGLEELQVDPHFPNRFLRSSRACAPAPM